MPTLLDTHAWLWWVTEDRRLSKRAGSAIATARHHGAVLVTKDRAIRDYEHVHSVW